MIEQVAYFLSWPILGSAIILLGTPTEQQILKVGRSLVESSRNVQYQVVLKRRSCTSALPATCRVNGHVCKIVNSASLVACDVEEIPSAEA